MYERIRRGWRMAKMAFRVLREDKKLLVLPLLSFISLVVVLVSFLLPILGSADFRDMLMQNNANVQRPLPTVIGYVFIFCFYLCNYFVIIFFNAALVTCVLLHFEGEEPTLDDGLRAAFSRLPQIFLWALVSATVGLVLKMISDRSKTLGKIVVNLLGMAWATMTYFVVPVLVVEKVGPFKAMKRSMSILTKTWGEAVVSNSSLGFIMFLLFVACWIPFILGCMVGGPAWLVGLGAHVIVVTALYQYAALKRTPKEYFKEGTLRNAFATK